MDDRILNARYVSSVGIMCGFWVLCIAVHPIEYVSVGKINEGVEGKNKPWNNRGLFLLCTGWASHFLGPPLFLLSWSSHPCCIINPGMGCIFYAGLGPHHVCWVGVKFLPPLFCFTIIWPVIVRSKFHGFFALLARHFSVIIRQIVNIGCSSLMNRLLNGLLSLKVVAGNRPTSLRRGEGWMAGCSVTIPHPSGEGWGGHGLRSWSWLMNTRSTVITVYLAFWTLLSPQRLCLIFISFGMIIKLKLV